MKNSLKFGFKLFFYPYNVLEIFILIKQEQLTYFGYYLMLSFV
jgi:hypothetical protein